MHSFGEKKKPVISYPCDWQYKVIGQDVDDMQSVIAEIMGMREYRVTHSHSSEGGKYHSLNIELVVFSEEERNTIFSSLGTRSAIKMVL